VVTKLKKKYNYTLDNPLMTNAPCEKIKISQNKGIWVFLKNKTHYFTIVVNNKLSFSAQCFYIKL
jgi:hypothetical protein